jgi:hypothetical protein
MKFTRILAIAGVSAAAVVGLASTAGASVNVQNGVGTAGKGDVQSALHFNDGALQTAWTNKNIKFTADASKLAVDYPMTCFDLNGGGILAGVTGHRQITYTGTVTLAATPDLNPHGKVVGDFHLSVPTEAAFSMVSGSVADTGCPTGSVLFSNTGTPTQPGTISVTGGLKVNGIDLPNTPIG